MGSILTGSGSGSPSYWSTQLSYIDSVFNSIVSLSSSKRRPVEPASSPPALQGSTHSPGKFHILLICRIRVTGLRVQEEEAKNSRKGAGWHLAVLHQILGGLAARNIGHSQALLSLPDSWFSSCCLPSSLLRRSPGSCGWPPSVPSYAPPSHWSSS